MKDIARYALRGSQSDSSLASEILIYQKVALGVIQRNPFHLLPLNWHDQGMTVADLKRMQINHGLEKKERERSERGQRCLEQMKHQTTSRCASAENPRLMFRC